MNPFSKEKKWIKKEDIINFQENFELIDFLASGGESYKIEMNKNKNKNKKMFPKKTTSKDNNNDDEIKLLCLNYVEKKNKCFMEYTKYGNLRDFQKKVLNQKIFPETFLCFLSYQILNGLKYIHRCKITHFDLQPQNILIDDNLNVKLYDFSVALDYSGYSEINNYNIKLPFIGTCIYIPEVIKSEKINIKDLNKIDLYSLGILLYHLAFCHYPFEINKEDFNKKYDEIYKKIMKDLIIESNNYSPHFKDFLKNLLEKDINQRLNINEALNHYWIKGCSILLDEKEKIDNDDIFLKYLITGHIKDFNDYIFKKK